MFVASIVFSIMILYRLTYVGLTKLVKTKNGPWIIELLKQTIGFPYALGNNLGEIYSPMK